MSNETKIGLLAVVAVAMLIWGFKFLKGKNILSSSNYLYAQYNNVDQLSPSSPVLINGFQIGIVSNIYFKDDMQGLEVELDIDKGVKIPKNAVANIVSTGIMGGKGVIINFDKPCNGEDCAKSGDFLVGKTKGMLSSMIGDPKDINGYMGVMRDNASILVDTLRAKFSDPDAEGAQSVDDIKTIIANLKTTTFQLNRIMTSSTGKIDLMLGDLQSLAANLKTNNSKINSIIANADQFSGQLKNVDISTTLTKANDALASATLAINDLKGTLASADETMQGVNSFVGKVNGGEGTLGMLVNDEELYNNIDKAVKNLDFLLQDVRLNPKRYTRVLSKKQVPYVLPADDPVLKSGN